MFNLKNTYRNIASLYLCFCFNGDIYLSGHDSSIWQTGNALTWLSKLLRMRSSAMTCLVACDAGKNLLVPICWIAKGIFLANTEVNRYITRNSGALEKLCIPWPAKYTFGSVFEFISLFCARRPRKGKGLSYLYVILSCISFTVTLFALSQIRGEKAQKLFFFFF